jgi:hypothetical protein
MVCCNFPLKIGASDKQTFVKRGQETEGFLSRRWPNCRRMNLVVSSAIFVEKAGEYK